MTDLVDPTQIESIVGTHRRDFDHVANMVTGDEKVYILHSKMCVTLRPDLRECPFSRALDRGVIESAWDGFKDMPVVVGFIGDHGLFPINEVSRRN